MAERDQFVGCDEPASQDVHASLEGGEREALPKRAKASDTDVENLETDIDNTKAHTLQSLASVQKSLADVGTSCNSHCSSLETQVERRLGQVHAEVREQSEKTSGLQGYIQ
ncbi:unnamed protein product, partial [Prorocentrum cordatum]